MPKINMPEYESVYEVFDGEVGDLISWDMAGFRPLDEVELFLAHMSVASDDVLGDVEVEHLFRSVVPAEDFDGEVVEGVFEYVYSQTATVSDAIPVTRIKSAHHWDRWCINNPTDPATTGIPAASIVSGEDIVDACLVIQEAIIDARVVATRNTDGKGYIYFCAPCYRQYDRLQKASQATGLVEFWDRLR